MKLVLLSLTVLASVWSQQITPPFNGGGSGSSAFGALTSGTNTAAAMVVGSGATLGVSGSGTIAATSLGALTGLPSINANTILGNGTASSASPTALSVPSCSGASNALIWTSATGFGCNSITAGSSAFSSLTSGTNTAAAMLVGTGASLGVTGSGTIAATSLSALTGMPSISANTIVGNGTASGAAPTALSVPSCSGATNALIWTSGTGFGCNTISGGSSAFSSLTSGTNTAAAMLVGTGASLGTTGTGTITATAIPVTGITGMGTGVSTWLATPSGANLATALTSSLPTTKGGTGVANGTNNTITFTGNFTLGVTLSANTAVTLPTSGTLLNNSLASTDIFVGNVSGVATGVAMSQDCTLSNTGVITCTKTNNVAFGTAATVNTGTSGTTIPLLNGANTWSGVQTFTNSDISLLGSSTGHTIFQSANASSTSYTLTFPAATDTVVTLAATQTLTNKSIAGSEINSGLVTASVGGTGVSNTATLTLGSSNVNLATLGTGIVKNTTTTGALTNAAAADVYGSWSGTCSSSTYLRGDGTCASPSGSGTVNSGTSGHITYYASTGAAVSSDANLDDGATTANTLTYAGSGGIVASGGAISSGSSPPASTGTGIAALAESTGQTCPSAADCVIADSGTHAMLLSNNGGTASGIVTLAGTQTLTNKTLTGPLLTNPGLDYNSSISAGTGAGEYIAGSGLTAGLVYYVASTGFVAAEANSSTTVPGVCLAITTTACAFSGVYQFSSSQSWTVGTILYLSDSSAGALVTSAPTTSGHYVQRIGVALAAGTIMIMPSMDVGGIQ